MSSIKTRLSNARAKLSRRASGSVTSTATRSVASSAGSDRAHKTPNSIRKSASLSKLPEGADEPVAQADQRLSQSEVLGSPTTSTTTTTHAAERRSELDSGGSGSLTLTSSDRHRPKTISTSTNTTRTSTSTTSSAPPAASPSSSLPAVRPAVTLQQPTPVHPPVQQPVVELVPAVHPDPQTQQQSLHHQLDPEHPSELPSKQSPPAHPGVFRRQSLVNTTDARIIKTLLGPDISASAALSTAAPTAPAASDYFGGAVNLTASMLHRKIWVKRPNASATLVQIREDDLVDDVRDMILKKYANSLGRSFDSPDVTLRIVPRDANGKAQDRMLGPEEEMCRTLDAYYPGGQTVNDALLIEVPQRRTPKPSPRVPVYYAHHDDSLGPQTEYFPPMPILNPSPAAMTAMTASAHEARGSIAHGHGHPPHSIAVLSTGQLPPLPSPGGTRRGHHMRPKYARHNTASPTTLTGGVPSVAPVARPSNRPRHDSSASDTKHSASSNPPIPTPPAPADVARQTSTPPTPRVASPRPEKKRKKPKAIEPPSLPAGLLDGSVPPINVLIVEDNIINLRVLGAFMQRLKVRWQRAMNGKEAVTKWRAGGFHLVLMDIQLPIMNGLEATKEIRRLERVNSIGVFSSGSKEAPNNRLGMDGNYDREIPEDDKLGDLGLFKSPVIIVALTASSLQSDRHEALAAGCNDFLTKPVNFVWLERKVKEWGCMQALIDFDGWRKWKDFAAASDTTDGTSKLSTSYSTIAPRNKSSTNLNSTMTGNSPTTKSSHASTNGAGPSSKSKDEEKKNKRKSQAIIPQPVLPEEESTGTATPDLDSSGS